MRDDFKRTLTRILKRVTMIHMGAFHEFGGSLVRRPFFFLSCPKYDPMLLLLHVHSH